MTENQTPKGHKLTEAQRREARLAETLRKNLHKRKAAARKAAQKSVKQNKS